MNTNEEEIKRYFTSIGDKYPEEYRGYYSLWAEVLMKGINAKDVDFFSSKAVEHICSLMDINVKVLREALPADLANAVREKLCKRVVNT